MQLTVKNRETLNGTVTVQSAAMDVSDVPMVTATLVVHSIAGTSPNLAVQLETSDNLEDWQAVGSPVALGAAGMGISAFQASANAWGRYIRAGIALTGGGTPLVVYSLWVNTFPSS